MSRLLLKLILLSCLLRADAYAQSGLIPCSRLEPGCVLTPVPTLRPPPTDTPRASTPTLLPTGTPLPCDPCIPTLTPTVTPTRVPLGTDQCCQCGAYAFCGFDCPWSCIIVDHASCP